MDIRKVICISTASHSDFELYLISEKYGIPYDFLYEYKMDSSVSKFWFEVSSFWILAIEVVSADGKKSVELVSDLTDDEKRRIMLVSPIMPGEPTADYSGNLADKQTDFIYFTIERDKYREEMLNRDYDPSNIICIDVTFESWEIFSICIVYSLDFILVSDFIRGNPHVDMKKVWFEKNSTDLVAYSYFYEDREIFEVAQGCLIPKVSIANMSMFSVDVPDIKTSPDNVAKYASYKSMGYNLKIKKFDLLIENGMLTGNTRQWIEVDSDSFSIKELEMLMYKAVEEEDYESAAYFRDEINRMK